jgi:hypothetical protein
VHRLAFQPSTRSQGWSRQTPESEGKRVISIFGLLMLHSSSYLTDIQLTLVSVTSLSLNLSPTGHTPVTMDSELTGTLLRRR